MEQENSNPYAAPLSDVGGIGCASSLGTPLASRSKRFLDYLIDRVAVVGIMYAIAKVTGYSKHIIVGQGGVMFLNGTHTMADIAYTYLAGSVLYYTCLEGLFGRSAGKWITGTKVVMMSGASLGFSRALLRSLCRLVPLEPFSFLGAVASGWHDKWTNTRVVDLRARPVVKARP
ncbi:RDD family protein [Prosthecobacter vanneervenii]|uniref:Putative RDD family membrane protein YckC n=1 Tax=Prosthecobacter vanneervenii TaxID=48466 RepID=A0A7W7Y786_9BACT|nr:RDD family protein [Prosthecobacter vanneervenii]MBB5030540.1 putative RDD family membrane protein YckC [Prosthecobacter vanneervenii]